MEIPFYKTKHFICFLNCLNALSPPLHISTDNNSYIISINDARLMREFNKVWVWVLSSLTLHLSVMKSICQSLEHSTILWKSACNVLGWLNYIKNLCVICKLRNFTRCMLVYVINIYNKQQQSQDRSLRNSAIAPTSNQNIVHLTQLFAIYQKTSFQSIVKHFPLTHVLVFLKLIFYDELYQMLSGNLNR